MTKIKNLNFKEFSKKNTPPEVVNSYLLGFISRYKKARGYLNPMTAKITHIVSYVEKKEEKDSLALVKIPNPPTFYELVDFYLKHRKNGKKKK